jgi:UDP-N-acetylmuramate--alanine ligase
MCIRSLESMGGSTWMFSESRPMPDGIGSIHFIGIGGVGMSGIALVAHDRGLKVSGSDLKESRATAALREAGVEVFIGQSPENVAGRAIDVVVVSSAIPPDNPELVALVDRGVPVWARARMLAWLGRGRKTLAVAGTHGKTTTSSMLATSLARLGADPTFLIGGVVDGYDTNASSGAGEHYVVEADESDGSFVYLDPYVAVITNIEEDHLDHYADLAAIRTAFREFAGAHQGDGVVIVCGDDPQLSELAHATGRKVLTYGFSGDCDIVCSNIVHEGVHTRFEVRVADDAPASVRLDSNPGEHNVLNATAVVAVLSFLGYGVAEAAEAVSGFTGVRRRFDFVGNVAGIDVVDDYGHHPTEVAATIKAACELGYRHVHVLFQPHRYSRTQALADEWGPAFDRADSVTFMDVYSAGEAPIPGVSGKTLVDSVLAHDPCMQVAWMPHRGDVAPYLAQHLVPGDLLLTMGAGDITAMGPVVLDMLQHEGSVVR